MEQSVGLARQVRGNGNRIVLVSFPAAGHVNPMLQLASLFYSKGFSITIFYAPFCLPESPICHCFDLKPYPDNLQKLINMNEIFKSVAELNSICQESVSSYLSEMLQEEHNPERIACVVSDPMMYFCQSFIDKFKVPQFILRTSGANTFLTFITFPLLLEKGLLHLKDYNSEELVDELPPLRIKDLPKLHSNNEDLIRLINHTYNTSVKWSGLIWNTFDYLEQPAISEIHKRYQVPIFTVGPLHKHAPLQASANLLVQDERCLEWLDKQEPSSVLYVSFGSIASIENSQFVETAWGLANCKLPFLWVLRPDLVRGLTNIELPDGFKEATRQRGLVVEWAPQQEVLAHKAVRGFLTHCGWNSTLESVYEGVPMLCWPSSGDQFVNSRIISHVWKVGIAMEGGLGRGHIEDCIIRLMVGKEGEELRERIKIYKKNAENCLKKGGSSCESLSKFMDCILPLRCFQLK